LIPATSPGAEPEALALDPELPVTAVLAVDVEGPEAPPVHAATDRNAPVVTQAAVPHPRCRRIPRL
jgi:hypothetical protein